MSIWILLRGLTREKRHWRHFPEQLMKELPDAQVIALELPGNGDLNALASPVDIAGMASHCRAEMAMLGVPPPYNVLAMSMGGMVAAAWAESHPEEIGACVLINTSFGAFSPLRQRLLPGAWPTLLRIALSRSAQRREQLVFELTTRLMGRTPGVVDEWVAISQSRPVHARNAWRQLIASARFRAPSTAPVPTLVLTSAGDRLVDMRCSADIARQWKCAISVHPAAGHDLPLDDGAWVAREIRQWLADL
jgi:pimeloyl-ACP methyl ester carboxylesterase